MKISFTKKEVEDVIKHHALDSLNIDTTGMDVFVSESYGKFEVEVDFPEKPIEAEA